MKLRVGLAQMNCEKNAIQRNLLKMLSEIDKALQKNVDVVCFPEMNLTGYSDPTKYPEMIITLENSYIRKLLEYTKNYQIIIILGLIEQNFSKKPFITQIAIRYGKIISVYRKITIKDEEELFFSPGNKLKPFSFKKINAGLTICADIDNESIFSNYAKQDAKIIFESAAPGLYGEQATRNWESGFQWWRNECVKKFSDYSKKNNVWILVATQAGRTIDEDFPGGGYVFNPEGKCVFETPNGLEGTSYLEIDLEKNSLKVF